MSWRGMLMACVLAAKPRGGGLRLLPIAGDDAKDMLLLLRAARLLQGFRGAPAVDLDAEADAIVRTGEAALALGPELNRLA